MKLARLEPLFERPGPWASVYADTRIADESTLERRELQARQAGRDLAAQGADDATCKAAEDALREAPYGAEHPGRAVFAADGEVVLDVPLSERPPFPGANTWAPLPHVGPLLDHAPEEPPCLVAYIDRTGADFELRTATGRTPLGQVEGLDWPVSRTPIGDWSERHFQVSVENTWEENAETIARALQECLADTGAGLVVLAGDERERRYVHERLPQHLRAGVVETDHGGRARGASRKLLDEDVADARRQRSARHVHDELERFFAARNPFSGRVDAAEGVPALIDAAREHQIAELFVSPSGADTRREVWAGPEPDQIAVRRSQVQYLGATDPFATRADDALIRSATTTGAEAVLVHPAAGDHAPLGGLGALLRWPQAAGGV